MISGLRDTDKVVDYFYDTCFKGADVCALWNNNDKSGRDIKKRVDKFISEADAQPFDSQQNDGSLSPEVSTSVAIRMLFKK